MSNIISVLIFSLGLWALGPQLLQPAAPAQSSRPLVQSYIADVYGALVEAGFNCADLNAVGISGIKTCVKTPGGQLYRETGAGNACGRARGKGDGNTPICDCN